MATQFETELERELFEALKPFAALCTEIERCAASFTSPYDDPNNWAKACTWEDLVRARAALNKARGTGGNEND